MTPERFIELKNLAAPIVINFDDGRLKECLDEIEHLQADMVKVTGSATLKLAAEVARARQSEIERLQAENSRLQEELDAHAFEISRPMLMARNDQLAAKNDDWRKLVESIIDNCSITESHVDRYKALCSPCPTKPPTRTAS